MSEHIKQMAEQHIKRERVERIKRWRSRRSVKLAIEKAKKA